MLQYTYHSMKVGVACHEKLLLTEFHAISLKGRIGINLFTLTIEQY